MTLSDEKTPAENQPSAASANPPDAPSHPPINYRLDGKIAIVTGAAQGIGRAIAETFALSGATVIVADFQTEPGKAAARELGPPAIFMPCDISRSDSVRALIDGVMERFGRIDVMVNNAGINTSLGEDRVTVESYSEDLWRRIIDVDLNGTFYCCKHASAAMIPRKSGSIINIASVAGIVALRLQIGYVAAKAGVIKMTEAMACELGPHGIRANCVSPGSTFTKATKELFYGEDATFRTHAERILSFIPQGRAGDTEDIAHAVAFLASDEAAYITGHNIVVDGGWIAGFNRDF